MIAYSENHSQYDTDSIRIFNMQDGTDYTIRADAGEKLKVLGYINSDFIYGIAVMQRTLYPKATAILFSRCIR